MAVLPVARAAVARVVVLGQVEVEARVPAPRDDGHAVILPLSVLVYLKV